MSSHIEKYAKWIWQDYTGASWENLKLANTRSMSGDVSFCYPVGSGSKSNYRPKSVFYHYQINDIDPNKYKITSVTFKLVMGRKTSTKTNDLPSVKVFTGDNNAPYKKEPLFTTSSYKLLDNYYDFDTYTLQYTIQNVSIADLKNIIFELDWKRTKVSYTSAVSINRAEVKVNYELKKPKWGLYSSVSPSSTTTNGKVAWKLTVKNTGEVGSESVTLTLPKGVTIVSSTGNGTYNTSTKTWSFKDVGKNKSVTDKATFTKYVPPKTADDTITYTFYETFANEERQYFDVQINGVARNHPTGTACYPIVMSSNCTLDTPLVYPNVYVLSESDDRVYGITGSYNDRICLSVEPNSDFEAHLRLFFSCDDSSDTGSVDMNANGTIFTGEFPILPPRGIIFGTNEATSRDKTYVPNSINIGAEEVWTIRASMHRHNFFDEKRENMEISIEDLIAYIGVVPLSRCHKADVTADSKNSLIENRYLNRVYYGKKGDYSEDIKMTLRIPWYDVATLQGLVEMDKPIPIDTIPTRADGDPLNHRGWAEIYEVTNIKKINDRLYECDVGVKYLSHDINTRFTIREAKKITEATIKYYLALIHNYNEDLLDIFNLNYYEFFTTLEDVNGDKIGSYDIDPNTSLIMSRNLNRNSTYDIVFRNQLPSLMSEDYDGNWEMALKVLNKDTNEVLFEHDYNNFKHYDFTTEYAENSADATTKYLTGNTYETLNFEKIGLGYDELSPLIEDRKIATHFNTMENVVIENPNDQFEIFLLDKDNNGISSQVVEVKVNGADGYSNRFNVMTDIYGRVLFNVAWGNGDYTVTLIYRETDKYRACEYSTNLQIEFDYVQYHFSYPSNVTALTPSYPYVITLLDENDAPVSGIMLHYSFKEVDGDYGYERTVTTDSDGNATIPIDWVNGTVMVRVVMKGFTDNGTVYQPVMFENGVNVNVQ